MESVCRLAGIHCAEDTGGGISLTHLSDIIRAALLEKYGGAWIDATVYADRLPPELFGDFYTLRAPGLFPMFISRGAWSPFLLSTNSAKTFFFYCLRSLFFTYWKEHDAIIDYLLIDYFICLMKNRIESVEKMIREVPEDRGFYALNLAINEAYSEEQFRHMTKSPLQKLTYKKELLMQTAIGQSTNYAHLLEKTGKE